MSTRLLRSTTRQANAPDNIGTQPVPSTRSDGQNVRVIVPATPGSPISRNEVATIEEVPTGDDVMPTEGVITRSYAEVAKGSVPASPVEDSLPIFDKKSGVQVSSSKSVEEMDGIRVSAVMDDSDGIRVAAVDNFHTQGNENDVSSAEFVDISSENDNGQGPWTVVQPRRSKSLDHLRRKGTRKEFPKYVPNKENRNSEHKNATSKKEPTEKVFGKVSEQIPVRNNSASPVPGRSFAAILKGKFADRNEEVKDSELDVEAQRVALENWNAVRDSNSRLNESVRSESPGSEQNKKHRKRANGSHRRKVESIEDSGSDLPGKHSRKPKKGGKNENIIEAIKPMSHRYLKQIKNAVDGRARSPDVDRKSRLSTQPADQLPKTSALAKILKWGSRKSKKNQKGRAKKRKESSPDSDTGSSDEDSDSSGSSSTSSSDDESEPSSPSSPSSSSNSDSESSESSSSSSESSFSDWDSESYRRSRRRKHARKKHSRSARRQHKKQIAKERRSHRIIKPIPPQEYGGEEDIEKYHRFVLEGTQFCREGRIPKDEQVFLISHYLSGKAHSFFTLKVARNHRKWTLQRFFEELFNFCFPINYRSQQREKIKRCYQNDRPVAEYVYELENLMNLVGAMGKRDKVIKLWDGFNKPMRYELHRAKLSKEVHTWKQIVSEAELIELADLDNELGICTKNKPQANKPNPNKNTNSFNNEQKPKNSFQKNGKWRNKSSNFQSQGSGQASSSSQPFSGKSNQKSNYSNHDNCSNKKTFDGKKTPRLSDAKRAQYDAEGRCYKCGQTRHFSRNCPTNNVVKSGGSGNGPPGLAARGMHFPETQDTALEELNETTETGVELVLNMMSFDSFTSDLAETPTFEFLSDSGSPFEDLTNDLFTIAEDEVEDDDDDDYPMPPLIAVSDSEGDDDDLYQNWEDWDDEESVNDSETHVDEDDNHHDHFSDHDDDDDLGPAGMAVSSAVSSSDTENEADDERSSRDEDFEGLPELQEVSDSDSEDDESDSDSVSDFVLDDPSEVMEGENEVNVESFGPFIPMNEEYLAQLNEDLEREQKAAERNRARKLKRTQWIIQRQGEVFSSIVADQLESSQPYPGDPEVLPLWSERFSVSQTSVSSHVLKRYGVEIEVIDHLRHIHRTHFIPTIKLSNFRPGDMWNEVCASVSGEGFPRFKDLEYARIGNRLGYEASCKLARHVPFIPDTPRQEYSSRDNYTVSVDPRDHTHYIIDDIEREFSVRIPTTLLLNPEFNLPAWYRKRLETAERHLLQRLKGPIE
ncbi:hypothetical protein FB446DRAFT_705819 [Lentinula raphanica]|nr:hypothetical protein FB446DRAFT_705819 [Lentinula raphanica]